MANRWTLCDLAEDEISALEAEGIQPTAQNILDIQALALDAMGDFDDGLRLHGSPVSIGGVVLWPMTIAGCIWRGEVEEKLAADDFSSRLYVLAYALAHGHDKEALSLQGRDALKAVLRWARGLRCSLSDLSAAVNDVMADRPRVVFASDVDAESGKSAPAEIAEMAMAIFGTDPDIWRYQLSLEEVIAIIRRHSALKKQKSTVEVRKVEALRELAKYVDDIRKRAKEASA